MPFELTALHLLAPLAVLIAGLSKGGVSPGAAFVATPLLALALPPAQAAAVMLPLLALGHFWTVAPLTIIQLNQVEWGLLFSIGVLGTAAHLLMTWALRLRERAHGKRH